MKKTERNKKKGHSVARFFPRYFVYSILIRKEGVLSIREGLSFLLQGAWIVLSWREGSWAPSESLCGEKKKRKQERGGGKKPAPFLSPLFLLL